jgi:hypothetical protein
MANTFEAVAGRGLLPAVVVLAGAAATTARHGRRSRRRGLIS